MRKVTFSYTPSKSLKEHVFFLENLFYQLLTKINNVMQNIDEL